MATFSHHTGGPRQGSEHSSVVVPIRTMLADRTDREGQEGGNTTDKFLEEARFHPGLRGSEKIPLEMHRVVIIEM